MYRYNVHTNVTNLKDPQKKGESFPVVYCICRLTSWSPRRKARSSGPLSLAGMSDAPSSKHQAPSTNSKQHQVNTHRLHPGHRPTGISSARCSENSAKNISWCRDTQVNTPLQSIQLAFPPPHHCKMFCWIKIPPAILPHA